VPPKRSSSPAWRTHLVEDDRTVLGESKAVGRRVLLTADVSRVESEGLFALESGWRRRAPCSC
jgi:hypothetical protein